uniref:Uncharacterized protein n=1 Tax=Astyanax mexicanus TaxID=7994 RepID=A0A8B9H135_ASTMX
MAANRDTPCRKFQANMFNKSKCQNCFRPRDTHLLTDEDLTQVSLIYKHSHIHDKDISHR